VRPSQANNLLWRATKTKQVKVWIHLHQARGKEKAGSKGSSGGKKHSGWRKNFEMVKNFETGKGAGGKKHAVGMRGKNSVRGANSVCRRKQLEEESFLAGENSRDKRSINGSQSGWQTSIAVSNAREKRVYGGSMRSAKKRRCSTEVQNPR
jgi:hypothetical protein